MTNATFIVCVLTATAVHLAPHYAPVIALSGCLVCALFERHRETIKSKF